MKDFALGSTKPDYRTSQIVIVIAIISIIDLIVRSNPHTGMLATNYALRPIGPVLTNVISYSWIETHQLLFGAFLIALTIVYWYVLAGLLKRVISYVRKKRNKRSGALIIFIVVLTSIPYGGAITDSNLSNNAYTSYVNVTSTRNLTIVYVRNGMDFDRDSLFSSDELVSPEELEVTALNHSKFIQQIYPFSDMGVNYTVRSDGYSASHPDNSLAGGVGVTLDFYNFVVSNLLSARGNDRVVGIVPDGYFSQFGSNFDGTLGIHYEFPNNFVLVEKRFYFVTAHELGHSFGLCDESSADFQDQDQNRTASNGGCRNHDVDEDGSLDIPPCSGNMCALSGSQTNMILELFPLANQVSSNDVSNIMSAGRTANDIPLENHWIDNETYSALVDFFFTNSPPVITNVTSIIVVGNISKSGNVTFKTFWTITGPTILTTQEDIIPGNFTIELRNASNAQIKNISFDPDYTVKTFGGNSTELNSSDFIFVFQAENTSVINLLENGQLKAQRTISTNVPVVNMISLDGQIFIDSFNVSWNGSDADNNSILYALLISSDGGLSWNTFGFDTTQTTYLVDNSDFSYGASYQVKILASDGVNTGYVQSGNFTIVPPPRVSVDGLLELYSLQERKVFEASVVNDGGQNLSFLAWRFDTAENNISNAVNLSLSLNEEFTLLVEYDYSVGGAKNVSLLMYDDNKSVNDTVVTSIFVGDLRVTNLTQVFQNGTRRIFNFTIYNVGGSNLIGINWTFNTGQSNLSATSLMNISSYNTTMVSVAHNYSDSGTYSVQATALHSFNNYSTTFDFEILDIRINDYSLLYQVDEAVVWRFSITNNLDTAMPNVSWRLNTGLENITSTSNHSLTAGDTSFVFVQYNYTAYNQFSTVVNATDGVHSSTRGLSMVMKEINISQLAKLTSNLTMAVFGFSVQNVFSMNKTTTWSFDTHDTAGIIWASSALTLTPNENVSVFFQHNFSATGNRSLLATANTSLATYNTGLNTTIS